MSDFNTSALRWTALTTRNPQASNAFIYSVTTTKIYCRPSCPSRLARRANIVFHDTPAQAEADGFRACMRCKPGTLKGEDGDPQRVSVDRAKKILENETDGARWSIKALAKELGLTESHFCRVFKKLEGRTVGDYRTLLQANAVAADVNKESMVDAAIVPPQKMKRTRSSGSQSYVTGQDITLRFDTAELEQNWHEFSGIQFPATAFDKIPFMELDFIDHQFDHETSGGLTPELLSDFSTPCATDDDGLQFLNFDGHDTPLYTGI
jgi:methylphosphotriester-DNA--protein-cysteine methyltransferase